MIRQTSKLYKLLALTIISVMMLSACGESGPTGQATATPGSAGTGTTPTAGGTGSDTTPTAGGAGSDVTPTTGGSTGGNGNGPALKDPTTIVEATIGDPQSLDPAWAYDSASSEIIFNVYETLLFP